MADDILKSLEEEAVELEDLLKANKGEEEDEEEDDEEEEEDEEKPKPKRKRMGKSLEEDIYEDGDDVYVDAAPILEKSMQVQEAAMDIAERNFELLKSIGSTVVNLAKVMKKYLGQPQGDLRGTNPPSQETLIDLNKSRNTPDEKNKYNGHTFQQAKSVLLKAFQDKEIGRDSITLFEQGGVVTGEAQQVLLKSKGGNQ